jgi:hypothetical protein
MTPTKEAMMVKRKSASKLTVTKETTRRLGRRRKERYKEKFRERYKENMLWSFYVEYCRHID